MAHDRGYTVFNDPQEVSSLLDQMRCMFEEADENDDKVLDFGEFRTLMSKFLPDSDETQLQEIFEALDTDQSGEIKYMELLETGFFTQFLEQSNAFMNNHRKNEMMMLRQTSEHVDYLETLPEGRGGSSAMKEQLKRQEESIDRLRQYMNDVGRPAERKVEELNIQIDGLIEENEHQSLQIQELEREIETLRAENSSLAENLEALKEIDEQHVQELNDLSSHGAEAENEMHIYKKKYAAEREKVISMNSQLSDLIRTNASCQNQIASLQSEVGKVRRDFQKSEYQSQRLKDRLDEMTRKYEEQSGELQEWMQTALDLESEIETSRVEISELESANFSNMSSHNRNPTMQIGTTLDLFKVGNFLRQESSVSMSGSLANDLDSSQMSLPKPVGRERAQSNWSRLQTTLSVSKNIKNLKPKPIREQRGYSPSPPPIDTEKLGAVIVEGLNPKISTEMDKLSTNVSETIEAQFAALNGTRLAHKRSSQNGSISFGDPATQTPAPAYTELISPRRSQMNGDVHEETIHEDMDFVDHEDVEKGVRESVEHLSEDIRALRTFIEGTGLGRRTSQDRVLNQILKQVSALKEGVLMLQENSDSGSGESDSVLPKPTEAFRHTLVADSEEMMRRVLGELSQKPTPVGGRAEWLWM